MFFEGSEKKIEIIVSKDVFLRSWKDEVFQDILKTSGCCEISRISNEFCTSYLLSESSMFVWDHRIVLITCGNTKLVQGALRILEELDKKQVLSLIYQRKNEQFPHFQETDFFKDQKLIEQKIKGKSYFFGRVDTNHLFLFDYSKDQAKGMFNEDSTLEVLMSDLPQSSRDLFKKSNKDKLKSYLDPVMKGFSWDQHYFNPEGYSLNAIKDQFYFTIHVTPENIGSYMSFETNLPLKDPEDLIDQILNIFKPASFTSILFEGKKRKEVLRSKNKAGFYCAHFVSAKLPIGYHVSYKNYFYPQTRSEKPFDLEQEGL